MQRRSSFGFNSVRLLFLLIFGTFSQVSGGEDGAPPDGGGGGGGDPPFFALRSCHQLLHGDAGEFFSPDYLCSNPPLWCNWTIQVDPGKRVYIHLEDLTPDDACLLKQDQVHVDEPAGLLGGHRVLQKCWREATFSSTSSTASVVLLIGGWPRPPYRGFYGRYQAFGPPLVYNPQEAPAGTDRKSASSDHPVNELEERMEFIQHPSDRSFDYYDQVTAEPDRGAQDDPGAQEAPGSRGAQDDPGSRGAQESPGPEVDGNPDPASTSRPTPGTSRSLRGAAHTSSAVGPLQRPDEAPPTAVQRDDKQEPKHLEDEETTTSAAAGETGTEEPLEETPPQPNEVELLSAHRGNLNIRNRSEDPHLPGDHLFEVAVEVDFRQDEDESWDELARSLLVSLKALIGGQLKALNAPPSMSSKRIKRLNLGALYILWLQIGQRPGGPQVHRAVHAALQGLIATDVGGEHGRAVITSVSTADVNECGTQLVVCDANADCVNGFGSYSCRCRPGFQDESRLGARGTVCVDVKAAGCSAGLSAETKGVYVLFFLLSSLILMLLVTAAMLYRRHRRGAFLVRCHSGSSISPPDDGNNNNNNNHRHHPDDGYSTPPDSAPLPPPPPPARWPQVKERRRAVDPPLLRFSSLLSPGGFTEPQEGEKK